MSRRLVAPTLAAATVLALAVGSPSAQAGLAEPAPSSSRPAGAPFKTEAPPMLAGNGGTTVEPLLTVGDRVRRYEFAGIPDGIAVRPRGSRGAVQVLLNHETSKVPFPATRRDSTNAILSRLMLHRKNAGVLRGRYAIDSAAGYQRFCSNFLAGKAEGFHRPTLLTVEEARDVVRREEDSWEPGLTLDQPGTEQAGVAVAYDVRSGRYTTLYGMGRFNHENAVAMRGYRKPVVLSGDDTFDAPGSQLYLYTSSNSREMRRDNGNLWAFKSSVASVNDYGDLVGGDKLLGKFIRVPRMIATGIDPSDGSDVTSADFDYPAPPGSIPDGPQWVLEHWSNLNNAFQFIRIEDMAPDRNDHRVLYFADSGEPRAIPDPDSTRLKRGPSGTQGDYMNGRVFKLTLGAGRPTQDVTLEVLTDFDEGGYDNPAEVHQPDNVETTKRAVYVTEDPGSHNKGTVDARVWRIDLATGLRRVVATVDQSSSPNPTTPGDWETAGLIDVSSIYGKGSFLINVQAHGWDEQTGEPDYDGGPTPYREQGQLLLIKVKRP